MPSDNEGHRTPSGSEHPARPKTFANLPIEITEPTIRELLAMDGHSLPVTEAFATDVSTDEITYERRQA